MGRGACRTDNEPKVSRNLFGLKGMAIVLLTVVIPSSFLFSCFREKNDTVEVVFDPQTSHTLRETNVISLISDSGITRNKIVAATLLIYGKASEPYWFFPDGIYLEKFDTLFNIEASIKADTAYRYLRRKLWELRGQVDMSNLEGVRFQTEQIFWNEQDEKYPFYSDVFIHVTQGESSRSGIGFKANQDMSIYEIYNPTAEISFEMKQRGISDDSIPPPDSIIQPVSAESTVEEN